MDAIDSLEVPGTRFGDFIVIQVIYRGTRSLVLRCQRDNEPIVVKFLRLPFPGAEDVARFRHEYELSRKIANPHLMRADVLGSYAGLMLMSMPDDNATDLKSLLGRSQLPLGDVLAIAMALVEALAAIHAKNILHKDIAPGNIVVDLTLTTVKLIDFGIATEISNERPELARPERLEGSLGYMAPEQTGRMNRDVDYRADFYGLGATLYHRVAGRPLFEFSDPVEAVHAHLTRKPLPLLELRKDTPAALAALIERLLEKEPEARYQSHAILLRDLGKIRAAMANPWQLDQFVIGSGDFSERFQVSGRMYGRGEESRQIVAAFEAAAGGTARLVTIAGVAGIGKTSLVNEVHRTLLAHRGTFVSGKFSQLGQFAPYSAFFQALQQRIRQILSLDDTGQKKWRERLGAAFGSNAGLLFDALPDLQRLLGIQPAITVLGPTEAEIRFLNTLYLCIEALATRTEPLVLFIDDMQWADRSSRRLLRELAFAGSLKHVLLICAYRTNEVPPGHPFANDLADYCGLCERLLPLTVGPLTVADVLALTSDTLHIAVDEATNLAQLCFDKTGGNPFFLRRFLEDLHHRQLIWLDQQTCLWRWSVERIAAENISDNIIELMVSLLRRLPLHTSQLLTTAACLGTRFDLSTLAAASMSDGATVARKLKPALEAQVIIPTDRHYKWADLLNEHEHASFPIGFSFAHDRVQEAAYLLASDGERRALHLRVGRMLLAGLANEPLSFEVVNHLNAGIDLIDDVAERIGVARLNAQIAQTARDAAAFDLAADYAQRAIDLFGPSHWIERREEALALHILAARMAYLGGFPERMTALIRVAGNHTASAVEQVRLIEIRIEALYASGNLADTLDLGLEALRLLDAELPSPSSPRDLVALIATVKAEIEQIGIKTLAERSAMSEPLPAQQIAIIAKMTAAAYIGRPALLPLLTILQIRLMMAYGHAPAALSAYSIMGVMCAEFLNDLEFGYRLGRMSVELVDRHGWRQAHAHAAFSFNNFLRHWSEPLANSVPALLDVHHSALEFGNLRHAGLALPMCDTHALLNGSELNALGIVLTEHQETLKKIRQPVAANWTSVLQAVVADLQSDTLPLEPLESRAFSGRMMERIYGERSDQTGAMFLHAFRCMLDALGDRSEAALAAGENAAKLFSAGRGMFMVPVCIFFTAASALRLARKSAGDVQASLLDQARAALARFDLWAQSSADLAPLRLILRGMLSSADGDATGTQNAFTAALDKASALGNLFFLGVAHLYAGRVLADDKDPGAQSQLADAHTVFLRWGACGAAATIIDAGTIRPHPGLLSNSSSNSSSHLVDNLTLTKAVQAITSEIDRSALLRKLLRVLLENAGAQRAAIVLEGEGGWFLQGEAAADGFVEVLQQLPMDEAAAHLPVEILRSVLNSGGEILIHDIQQESVWSKLPYFRTRNGKSLLCLSLIKQSRVVGALLLENGVVSHAFSPSLIEFLHLLLGNVVNAIENARLFAELRTLTESLERRVAERTQALQESEARIHSILSNAPMPMSVARRSDALLMYVNAPAAAMMGMREESLIGKPAPSLYRNPQDRHQFFSKYLQDGIVKNQEACLVASDGTERWVLVSLVPIVYGKEVADLATLVDITERKAMEEQLRRLATTDSLTGVANRGHFFEKSASELIRAKRYARPLCLIMLDIDHFKKINDSHGHAIGDNAIRTVVDVCVSTVRQTDLVARVGGEEFVVLLPETPLAQAIDLAERLRQNIALRQLMPTQGQGFSMTASFGVSEMNSSDEVSSLLARADEALYASKHSGRNRVTAI